MPIFISIMNPLFSKGTHSLLCTCKPPRSWCVVTMPCSCLDDNAKFGRRLRTPSSIDTSTIILPNDLAGGTYSPPLSYRTPIQVQLAESATFAEQTMYAFFPDNTSGLVKFLNIVSPIENPESLYARESGVIWMLS